MANDEGIPDGWVRQCVDRIVDECGYASYNELAIALGKNRANIDAWIARNTYGRDGMTTLHDKTGADANWLLARGDVAFPTGLGDKMIATIGMVVITHKDMHKSPDEISAVVRQACESRHK